MRGILYLARIRTKNLIVQTLRNPASLVLFILIAAGVVLMMAASFLGNTAVGQSELTLQADPMGGLLPAGIFLTSVFLATFILFNGLSSGSTLFDLPDVVFLFPAPVRPQLNLLYGIARQSLTFLLMSAFLLLWVPGFFESLYLTPLQKMAVYVGWPLLFLGSQLIAMGAYSLTATRPMLRKFLRGLLYGFLGVTAISFLLYLQIKGGTIHNAMAFFHLPVLYFFPFAGQVAGLVYFSWNGQYGLAGICLFLSILFPAVVMFFVQKSQSDYYEDVLQATETIYQTKQAAKENALTGAGLQYKKVKAGKSGFLGTGTGASAFFFRHLTEQRRTGFIILDKLSVLLIFLSIMGGILLRREGLASDLQVLIAQAGAIVAAGYLLYFSVIYGKFNQELSKYFIYLAPVNGMAKLFYANLSVIVKSVLESFIAFSILTVMAGFSFWFPILGAFCYGVLSALFSSVYILTQRLFGKKRKILSGIGFLICGGILQGPVFAVFIGLLVLFAGTGIQLSFLAYVASGVLGMIFASTVFYACQSILSDYSDI